MGLLLHGVPTPFVIVVVGEATGMTDAELQEFILASMSFTARMGGFNRSVSVMVGKNAAPMLSQIQPGKPNGT